MQTRFTRTLVALSTVGCMAAIASAEEVGFSDFVRQLSGQQPNQVAEPGLQQVAYFSDIDAIEEPLPESTTAEAMPYQAYPGPGCCPTGDCGACGGQYCHQPNAGMYYAEAQLMFLRAHVSEAALGKLSEKYEFTPRFIFGYEAPSGLGARARYWTYGRTTPNLEVTGDDLRLDFDVIDVEGTSRFRTSRTELVLSGGFRWANIDIETNDNTVGSEMPGITFAADVRSALCRTCRSQWSGVCGARWSLLGGDWEGDDNAFLEEVRDDNMVTQEIYGGFEYLCHYSGYDLYARIVFELQNWHSDAFAENADTDSIGFVGPGIHVGATF